MSVSGVQTVQSAELTQFLSLFMASSNQKLQAVKSARDALDVRAGLYSDLRTKLTNLKRAARELSPSEGGSPFADRTASVSLESILSASAGASAPKVAHAVHVDQLAKAHSIISSRLSKTETSLADIYTGGRSFTIQTGSTTKVVRVEIDGDETNAMLLEKVAAAINETMGSAARAASLADTDSTVRLSLTAGATGAANSMTITDPDGLLATLGLTNNSQATDTAGGYIHADLGNHELDAKLTVDGIHITRSTNTITDVSPGLTLTLKAAQAATDPDVNVSVQTDTKSIREKIQKFIDAYNDTHTYLASKTKLDRTTFERGPLGGDYQYVSLVQKMRTAVAATVDSSAAEEFFALGQVGISSNGAGALGIQNASRLDQALSGNLDDFEKLFTAADGIAGRLDKVLDAYTREDGTIQASTGSTETQKKLLTARIDRLVQLQELEKDRLVRQFGAIQQASQMQQSMQQMLGVLSSFTTG